MIHHKSAIYRIQKYTHPLVTMTLPKLPPNGGVSSTSAPTPWPYSFTLYTPGPPPPSPRRPFHCRHIQFHPQLAIHNPPPTPHRPKLYPQPLQLPTLHLLAAQPYRQADRALPPSPSRTYLERPPQSRAFLGHDAVKGTAQLAELVLADADHGRALTRCCGVWRRRRRAE